MTTLHWFLLFVVVVWGSLLWFLRGVMAELSKQATSHAKLYAAAYAKGGALIAIAVFTSFGETFEKLSSDVAVVLPWWSWLSMFFQPVIAGLAVYVAFVDSTVKKIKDEREGK